MQQGFAEFQHSKLFNRKGRFRFQFRLLGAVPVPLSVSGKNGFATVPVSGSGFWFLSHPGNRSQGIIFVAKASFSAYLLGKISLETGGKVHFSTKKSTTKFGRPFCSFPFPIFALKWLKVAVFAIQEGKKVGRKRGLRHFRNK